MAQWFNVPSVSDQTSVIYWGFILITHFDAHIMINKHVLSVSLSNINNNSSNSNTNYKNSNNNKSNNNNNKIIIIIITVDGRKEMFYLMMHPTHFILRLYGVG